MTKRKAPEQKKKTGRPSKYAKMNLAQVETVAGFGFIDLEIAAILNIAPSTLALYKKKPEFSEALKKGKAKADYLVIQSMHGKAIAGDVTAGIFWLKNRRRDMFGERQGIDLGGSVRMERGKMIVEVVEVKTEIPGGPASTIDQPTPDTAAPAKETGPGGPKPQEKPQGPGPRPGQPAAKAKPKARLYARPKGRPKAPAAPAATPGPRPRSLSTGTTRPGPSPGRPPMLKTGGPTAAKPRRA